MKLCALSQFPYGMLKSTAPARTKHIQSPTDMPTSEKNISDIPIIYNL